jgi:hypothetical protein
VAACALPEQYSMTILMYHQQCLQVCDHKRTLELYFKGRLRPTATLQLLVSIPGIGDITGAIIAMETGEIQRFATRLEQRSNATIARTVVAKELAKIVYYVLTRQQPCTSFKGIAIKKRYDWPRTCKLDRARRSLTTRAPNWRPAHSPDRLIGMQVRCR